MRIFGYYWGITGVISIVAFAIFRLTPRALELLEYNLAWQHWVGLLVFIPYMGYAEGYKGFYLNFSPRIIARANYLRETSHPLLSLLAPLFCMGYFYATKKRMITSVLVTSGIFCLVILVSYSTQPWRGVIDAGVVVGLLVGVSSIFWYWIRQELGLARPDISADLPA